MDAPPGLLERHCIPCLRPDDPIKIESSENDASEYPSLNNDKSIKSLGIYVPASRFCTFCNVKGPGLPLELLVLKHMN